MSHTVLSYPHVASLKYHRTATRYGLIAGLLVMLVPVLSEAHVSIWPRQANNNTTEKYSIRVPNEEKVTATSFELEVPEGVDVEAVQATPGITHHVRRDGTRIVSITWEMKVQPGDFVELGFIARNGPGKTQIIWPMRQRHEGGKTTDWTNGPNGLYANTAVTKLVPGRNFIDLR